MNILLLRDSCPDNPFNGWDNRLWHLINKGGADVLCFQAQNSGVSSIDFKSHLPWRRVEIIQTNYVNLAITHKDLIPHAFLAKTHEPTKALRCAVEGYLSEHPKTCIIASGYAIGLMAATFLSGRFIFDCSDSMSLYFQRRYRVLSSRESLKKANSIYMSAVYRALESEIARHAALYVVTAEADRQSILQSYSKANVIAIGIGTDWLNLPPIERMPDNSELTVAFHAGMTWEPNRFAALYLIKEIFPKIRAAFPQAKLRIAGAPVFEELKAFSNRDGVEICGFVDDIRSWLAQCDVYAMPMLLGSGVKTKLMEAMSAGLPIVTNSLGAEALPAEAKDSLIIADGSQEISMAIIDLLRDSPYRKLLGEKARYFAKNNFAWPTLSQMLMQAIEATNLSI